MSQTIETIAIAYVFPGTGEGGVHFMQAGPGAVAAIDALRHYGYYCHQVPGASATEVALDDAIVTTANTLLRYDAKLQAWMELRHPELRTYRLQQMGDKYYARFRLVLRDLLTP